MYIYIEHYIYNVLCQLHCKHMKHLYSLAIAETGFLVCLHCTRRLEALCILNWQGSFQMASEVILQRQSLLESGIRTGVKDVENRSIDTKEREVGSSSDQSEGRLTFLYRM